MWFCMKGLQKVIESFNHDNRAVQWFNESDKWYCRKREIHLWSSSWMKYNISPHASIKISANWNEHVDEIVWISKYKQEVRLGLELLELDRKTSDEQPQVCSIFPLSRLLRHFPFPFQIKGYLGWKNGHNSILPVVQHCGDTSYADVWII